MELENREELKLVFINKKGRTHDGNYEYDFLYSFTPEVVWGEDFAEQVPSTCMIDDLLPSPDTYHLIRNAVSPTNIKLAQENSCFSMQDCIDGIIALAWVYDEDDGRYYPINYGTPIAEADEFFEPLGFEFMSESIVNSDTHDDEEKNSSTLPEVDEEGNPIVYEDFTNKIKKVDDLLYVDDEEGDAEDLEKLFNGDF